MSVDHRDDALAAIAAYAGRQATHHETDGLGEARSWRHIQTIAQQALTNPTVAPTDDTQRLWAVLYTTRRRLHSHASRTELLAYLDHELR